MKLYGLICCLTLLGNQVLSQRSDTAFFPFQCLDIFNAISRDSIFTNYDLAIKNYADIKVLDIDLDEHSRSKLEYDLCEFPNIEILVVNGFYHPNIKNKCNKNLRLVVLSNFVVRISQISTLLENTTYLDIVNNEISELKTEHTRLLIKTKALRFANNRASSISFNKRTNPILQSLDISGNNLNRLPKNIEVLNDLVYLDISFNKLINYIDPEKIKKLKKLRILVIEGLELQESNLSELKKLPINLVFKRE